MNKLRGKYRNALGFCYEILAAVLANNEYGERVGQLCKLINTSYPVTCYYIDALTKSGFMEEIKTNKKHPRSKEEFVSIWKVTQKGVDLMKDFETMNSRFEAVGGLFTL